MRWLNSVAALSLVVVSASLARATALPDGGASRAQRLRRDEASGRSRSTGRRRLGRIKNGRIRKSGRSHW